MVRHDRVPDRRRDLHRHVGLAGLRAVGRSDRPLARRPGDDGPQRAVPAHRRCGERPVRSAPRPVAADLDPWPRGRSDGPALALRRSRALAPDGARGVLRGRHRVLRTGVRRDRSRPRGHRPAHPGERARPVRPTGGVAARGSGPRRLPGRVEHRRRVPGRRGDVRRLDRRVAVHEPTSDRHPAEGRPSSALAADVREGFRFVREPRVAVGDARSPRRSPTCCSSDRRRCCCRSSSRTTGAAAR